VTGIAFALNEQGKQRGKCKSCGRLRKKCQIDFIKVLVELDAIILPFILFTQQIQHMTPRSHDLERMQCGAFAGLVAQTA
jgi:hypothetical protein